MIGPNSLLLRLYRTKGRQRTLPHRGKYHCMADLLFGLDLTKQVNLLSIRYKQSS